MCELFMTTAIHLGDIRQKLTEPTGTAFKILRVLIVERFRHLWRSKASLPPESYSPALEVGLAAMAPIPMASQFRHIMAPLLFHGFGSGTQWPNLISQPSRFDAHEEEALVPSERASTDRKAAGCARLLVREPIQFFSRVARKERDFAGEHPET